MRKTPAVKLLNGVRGVIITDVERARYGDYIDAWRRDISLLLEAVWVFKKTGL